MSNKVSPLSTGFHFIGYHYENDYCLHAIAVVDINWCDRISIYRLFQRIEGRTLFQGSSHSVNPCLG